MNDSEREQWPECQHTISFLCLDTHRQVQRIRWVSEHAVVDITGEEHQAWRTHYFIASSKHAQLFAPEEDTTSYLKVACCVHNPEN